MVFEINAFTTRACAGLESLQQGGFFKRECVARVAGPFVAVPLVADAGVRVVTAVIACAIAALGAAFDLVGQFCKGTLGVATAVGTVLVGVVYPPATAAMCRMLGLANPKFIGPQNKPADWVDPVVVEEPVVATVEAPKVELTRTERAKIVFEKTKTAITANCPQRVKDCASWALDHKLAVGGILTTIGAVYLGRGYVGL